MLKRRKLVQIDLGKRYRAEEQFCRSLFALEEQITTKIEEALSEENYGAVGGYLREFYTKVCELIDKTKKEMKAIRIQIPPRMTANPHSASGSKVRKGGMRRAVSAKGKSRSRRGRTKK